MPFAVAVCLATAAAVGASGQSRHARAPTSAGVYVGAENLRGVAAFARWSGQNVTHVLDFEYRGTWAGIESPWFVPRTWNGRSRQVRGKVLVLSVPLLPNTGGTLAEGAAGAYNGHFRALARRLAAAGVAPHTIIRLGWEFNSGWSAWSAAADPAAYAEFFRQVVRTMRAVAPALRFDWCPTEGLAQFWGVPGGLAAAYPGDAYVDFVGMDTYDQGWGPNGSVIEDPAARWAQMVNEPGGLAWQARFAARHHKPMSYPEWGLTVRADGHGGGDDPLYVERMHEWMSTHRVAYQVYFDVNADDGTHELTDGQFPNAARRFVSLFRSPP